MVCKDGSLHNSSLFLVSRGGLSKSALLRFSQGSNWAWNGERLSMFKPALVVVKIGFISEMLVARFL